MATWGYGNFDNDTALNWIESFADEPKPKKLEQAFKKIAEAGKLLEISACEEGLAGAELVAAMHGNPSIDLPQSVQDLIDEYKLAAPPEMRKAAQAVVTRIRTDSELRALWEESDEIDAWLEAVDDLYDRLA